jgi:hypothetical protein
MRFICSRIVRVNTPHSVLTQPPSIFLRLFHNCRSQPRYNFCLIFRCRHIVSCVSSYAADQEIVGSSVFFGLFTCFLLKKTILHNLNNRKT